MPKKILIADDEHDVVSTVQMSLEQSGFEVVTASNGIEAVARVNEEKPDLVLMDLAMPEMDGLQALQQLKSSDETAHIPVIMLTAHDSYQEMSRGWDAGTDVYLTKPFIPLHLTDMVKSVLDI